MLGLYSGASSGYSASCDLVPPTAEAWMRNNQSWFGGATSYCPRCKQPGSAEYLKSQLYLVVTDDHSSSGTYNFSNNFPPLAGSRFRYLVGSDRR